MYGRGLGVGMTHLYRYISGSEIATDITWRWIDPGLIAVLGSGGTLGGVTRLALASTVIVVNPFCGHITDKIILNINRTIS